MQISEKPNRKPGMTNLLTLAHGMFFLILFVRARSKSAITLGSASVGNAFNSLRTPNSLSYDL
jgi:hypothetical protein